MRVGRLPPLRHVRVTAAAARFPHADLQRIAGDTRFASQVSGWGAHLTALEDEALM
jgi:hypothetical protein